MKSVNEDMAFWKAQGDNARSKQAALVAFGAYAALRLAKEDYMEWQPRETAPRDGKTYLAYTADFCGGSAFNICIQEAKWCGKSPDDTIGHHQSRNGQIVLYWMPLPDPPSDKRS